ncbi:hypothetical protein L218DRAFT_947461 [Marasmius fiardii PR-910]|nr:hypothetical protein L218DRAFT_947461 [Marasmius fiardii PR-910]
MASTAILEAGISVRRRDDIDLTLQGIAIEMGARPSGKNTFLFESNTARVHYVPDFKVELRQCRCQRLRKWQILDGRKLSENGRFGATSPLPFILLAQGHGDSEFEVESTHHGAASRENLASRLNDSSISTIFSQGEVPPLIVQARIQAKLFPLAIIFGYPGGRQEMRDARFELASARYFKGSGKEPDDYMDIKNRRGNLEKRILTES